MEKAIKKAMEGGYEALPKRAEFRSVEIDNDRWFLNFYDLEGTQSDHFTFTISGTLLDPLFWQSLGKACGWEEVDIFMDDYTNNHPFMGGTIDYPYSEGSGMTYKAEGWKYHWLCFVDHLADGKDPEEFFLKLIK